MKTLEVATFDRGNVKQKVEFQHMSVLEPGQPRPPDSGIFRIINQVDGDKRIVWSKMSLAEVREAKVKFNELVEQGMVPYRVGVDGKRAEVMKEFDPAAEDMIFDVIFAPIPALAGG